ncbi:hypothetical protein D3C74_328150 [compost metagenome]
MLVSLGCIRFNLTLLESKEKISISLNIGNKEINFLFVNNSISVAPSTNNIPLEK